MLQRCVQFQFIGTFALTMLSLGMQNYCDIIYTSTYIALQVMEVGGR